MHAIIVECQTHIVDASERGRIGRILATRLGALPGFITFVALDADSAAGKVTALCIVDRQAALNAAERAIAQWQLEFLGDGKASVKRLGMGALIAQRGL